MSLGLTYADDAGVSWVSSGSSTPIVTGQWTGEAQQMIVTGGGSIGGGLVKYQCPSGYSLRGSQCYNVLCDTGPRPTPRPIVPQNCIITPTVVTKQEVINCPPGSYVQ